MTNLKSIAIVFADLKGNVGDFAIFDAMLCSISKAFPNHGIDVYPHAFLDVDDQRMSAFLAAGEIDFQIVGETYYFPVPKILKLSTSINAFLTVICGQEPGVPRHDMV